MRNSFWNKRIPTLLGLLVLTFSVGLTAFLTNKETFFQIRASSSQQPQNVRITNITDTSFTVSYTTNEKISGSINYGKDQNLGLSALDIRDKQSGGLKNYQIHNIEVISLTPQTKYYFTIISGQDTYLNNNQTFQVSTGPTINNSSQDNTTIRGKVILPNGNNPSEAIVYVTSDNSGIFSALVTNEGLYEIPLGLMRTSDLSSYFVFTKDSLIKMLVYGENLSSNVSFLEGQNLPLPTITLSKDYDFTNNTNSLASQSASLETFPSFESTSSASGSKKPQILTPTKDQGFTDDQPLFKGTGLSKENVQIIIHSDENIKTQTTTDQNGNWSYKPPESLSPGEHTITIITRDASGILKTITQSFVVYAAGTQIPNAIGSPTPTPTPLPKLTTTPTPTPSILTYLTSTPSPTQVLTPTPVSTSSGNLLPPAGNPSIITIGILGLLISFIGGLLFLLTRGAFKL
jgi:hypothetical protein